MGWKKARALGSLACFLLLSSCSSIIGTHPFSKLPKSSGKLNKTPEVLILRGQDYVTCSTGQLQELKFFIYLKWMPAQEVWVWAGPASPRPEKPGRLFGTQLTVNMKAAGKPGFMVYHQLNIEVGGVVREVTSILVDCSFAGSTATAMGEVHGEM